MCDLGVISLIGQKVKVIELDLKVNNLYNSKLTKYSWTCIKRPPIEWSSCIKGSVVVVPNLFSLKNWSFHFY